MIRDANRFAEICRKSLFDGDEESSLARQYVMKERGLSEVTVRDIGFGYCKVRSEPYGVDNIDAEINRKLRGKIVVPIRSEFGSVAAFAARSPLSSRKGWWNTSFDKDFYMFLFDLSRKHIFKSNKVYIFEGYLDGAILYQVGLLNSVAIMGTSLGYRRIGLLARYCDEFCLCFDNDQNDAGLIGQLRTVSDLGMFGVTKISKIEPPQGVDPDEFVLAQGVDAFVALEQKLSADDIRLAGFQYEDLKSRRRAEALEKKRNAVEVL